MKRSKNSRLEQVLEVLGAAMVAANRVTGALGPSGIGSRSEWLHFGFVVAFAHLDRRALDRRG